MVKVRARVCRSSEAEGNCVAERWGGKQPEAKDRSVGDEPDTAGCCGEPADSGRSPKSDGHVEQAKPNDGHVTPRVWGRNDPKAERRKRGELCARVSAWSSQSPHKSVVGTSGEAKVAILWHRRGSGQQGRESCGVKVPTPSVTRFRTASISTARRGNKPRYAWK